MQDPANEEVLLYRFVGTICASFFTICAHTKMGDNSSTPVWFYISVSRLGTRNLGFSVLLVSFVVALKNILLNKQRLHIYKLSKSIWHKMGRLGVWLVRIGDPRWSKNMEPLWCSSRTCKLKII